MRFNRWNEWLDRPLLAEFLRPIRFDDSMIKAIGGALLATTSRFLVEISRQRPRTLAFESSGGNSTTPRPYLLIGFPSYWPDDSLLCLSPLPPFLPRWIRQFSKRLLAAQEAQMLPARNRIFCLASYCRDRQLKSASSFDFYL